MTMWQLNGLFENLHADPATTSITLKEIGKVKTHQSGVKDLAIRTTAKSLHLLTCGDDNAVALTLVSAETPNTIEVKVLASQPSAHFAAAVGIRWLTDSLAVSVGVDNNLAFWQLENLHDPDLRLVATKFTFVQDIAGLETIETSQGWLLLVFGVGVEIFRITI